MNISPNGTRISTEVKSIRTLYNMHQRGQLDFDWAGQRGVVWNNKLGSDFIHSILWGLTNKTETFRFCLQDGKLLCTDGKQRGTSILKFVDNQYKIYGVSDEFPIELFDGSTYSIRGKLFNQLPQELQDRIWDTQITISIVENATHKVLAEIFRKLNSGIQATTSEVAMSKNINIGIIDALSDHKLFDVMFPQKGTENRKYRPFVVQIYMILQGETDYSSRNLRKYQSTLDLTDDDIDEIRHTLDILFEIYKSVIIADNSSNTRMLAITFLRCFIPCVDMFNGDYEKAAEWINSFFENVPVEWKDIEGFQNEAKNVIKRIKVIRELIENFLK